MRGLAWVMHSFIPSEGVARRSLRRVLIERAMIWKHDERCVVYPPYIDAARTHAEGRRVALEHAVERPHVLEIARACEVGLGLACEIEEKAYSRDAWALGRVRVEWKREDGTLVRGDLDTRGKLLRAIAAEVRRHPDRDADGKPGKNPMYMTPQQVFEEYVRQVAGMAGPAPGTGKKAEKAKAAGGGSSKKKRR